MRTFTLTLAMIGLITSTALGQTNCFTNYALYDSNHTCVGDLINAGNSVTIPSAGVTVRLPTIVLRRFDPDQTPYGIYINAFGVPDVVTFIYGQLNCGGQAYLLYDTALPQIAWADHSGTLWAQTPKIGLRLPAKRAFHSAAFVTIKMAGV